MHSRTRTAAPTVRMHGRPCVRLWPLLALLPLSGCIALGNQIAPATTHETFSLQPGQLQQQGMAILTPSVVTGQEQDRQSLALIVAETVRAIMPKARVVTMSETVGAVNRAGLSDTYRQMYDNYDSTGLFRHESLARIGQAAGARYLVQLKLAGFNRDIRERFTLFGFRLFQTLHANVRLYIQIWDSEQGVIAWEAVGELHHAYDSIAEQPVGFRQVVAEITRQLLKTLP